MSESIYNDDPFHLFGTFLSIGDIIVGGKKKGKVPVFMELTFQWGRKAIYKDVPEVRDHAMRISKEKEFYRWKQ